MKKELKGLVMSLTLPTLSADGWLKDKRLIMGTLFNYFKTSLYHQSTIYYGNISSLDHLLKLHGDDESELKQEVKITLEKLYGKFYSEVVVEIEIKDVEYEDRNISTMFIDVIAKDTIGVEYKLSENINLTIDEIEEERAEYQL